MGRRGESNFKLIRQGEESHSNQWDPLREFLGTLLWGINSLQHRFYKNKILRIDTSSWELKIRFYIWFHLLKILWFDLRFGKILKYNSRLDPSIENLRFDSMFDANSTCLEILFEDIWVECSNIKNLTIRESYDLTKTKSVTVTALL